jgi:serine protease Do
MDERLILESIERYIRGEMLPEERKFFEELRKSNPGVDQMVVEHTVFLHLMEKYGDRKNVKSTLQDVHNDLFETGQIRQTKETRVVRLWLKYRKVIAVAASIACITALSISGITSYYAPRRPNTQIQDLSRKVSILQKSINDKFNKIQVKVPVEADFKLGGTGFMIDPRGYIVTNAHVIGNSTVVIVQNNKGQEFKTKIAYISATADLAFLKIVDSDYKSSAVLPYSISKGNIELGEAIFTLGYPRDEIVYGEGYLSAKTGYRGDTLACQIAVAANPGNSGGPVLDKNGEVIGVLSNRQLQTQGAVFAIRSKNIYMALDDMKSDSSLASIRLPQTSAVRNMDRVQQVKKIQDFIYLVKSY